MRKSVVAIGLGSSLVREYGRQTREEGILDVGTADVDDELQQAVDRSRPC